MNRFLMLGLSCLACSSSTPAAPDAAAPEAASRDLGSETADVGATSEDLGVRDAVSTDTGSPPTRVYEDVTETHLPRTLAGFSMDARPADMDGDGDLDLVVASEFRTNILLLNDGTGRMTDASDQLPRTRRDSEDVVLHDFDGDGDLDIFIASEDDRSNELYLRDGAGWIDASDRIPVQGTSNAAIFWPGVSPGVLLGNAGQNYALRWDAGVGRFVDVTASTLPRRVDQTQDLELADIDGDGDLDLLVANEDASVLLLAEGDGFLAPRILPGDAETREIDAFDADGDGDLDLVLANIRFLRRGVSRRNLLLLQAEPMVFVDASEERLPRDDDDSFDVDPVDLDGDGDLDLIIANLGDLSGRTADTPFRVYLNDGQGRFSESSELLPATAVGNGFDIEAADFDGDGVLDLYLASRGGADRLLLARVR